MIYRLDGDKLPTIPLPHDCVIDSVSLSDDFLILEFHQDLSDYASIQQICPNAKSLTIKMHLTDSVSVYQQKIRKAPKFESVYAQIGFDDLANLAGQNRVEYLYHYVGYWSLIVNLFCETNNIFLRLQTDAVEFLWDV